MIDLPQPSASVGNIVHPIDQASVQYRPRFSEFPSDTWYCGLRHPQSPSQFSKSVQTPKDQHTNDISAFSTSTAAFRACTVWMRVIMGCNHALPALVPTAHWGHIWAKYAGGVLDLKHRFAHVLMDAIGRLQGDADVVGMRASRIAVDRWQGASAAHATLHQRTISASTI